MPAAAALLALLLGATMLLAGLLHLGFLAEFISQPVLVGFKTGAGLFIAAGQLGKILGISVPAAISSSRWRRRSAASPARTR